MAEKESTNTMFQGAFVKNGDGDFALKTTGGGGGSSTVKIDPTQNTVTVSPNPLPTTLSTTGNTVKIDPSNNDVTALDPQRENKFETLTASGDVLVDAGTSRIIVCQIADVPAGYYEVNVAVGASKKPNDTSLSPVSADFLAGAKSFKLIFGSTGGSTEDPDENPEFYLNLAAPTTVSVGVTNNPAPSAGTKVMALISMTRIV